MNKIIIILFSICSVCMISCSSDTKYNLEPENLKREHSCADDGMIIVDYNGPKAQILWKNGKKTFYCEVREAFCEYLDELKKKNISAFFVQDFSNLKWGSYTDKWMKAENAFFVIDSIKDGAMGLSYVPFNNLDCAEIFKNEYSGKILKFSDININILFESNKLLKDRMIF